MSGGRTVLLLHEGVADRRGWAEVAGLLAPELTVVAYDRRGYGQTPPSAEPFSHLDDLLAVLDHVVAGLVVIGTAVSGAPEPELDAGTRRFEPLLDEAWAARDAGEINRLETWLWLDGPGQPEGEWAVPRGSWRIVQFGVLGAFRTLRAAWPAHSWGRHEGAVCKAVGCGWLGVSPTPQDLHQGPRRGD